MRSHNTRVFYHLTRTENAKSILENGLLPGNEIGKNNDWYGMHGNPGYVYTFSADSGVLKLLTPLLLFYTPFVWAKEKVSKKENREFGLPHKFSVLKVELPEDFKVERDYDQLLIYRSQREDELYRMARSLSRGGAVPFGTLETEEKIKDFIDKIPTKTWDRRTGSYRIRQGIPSKLVSKISWLDLLLRN